MKILGFEMSSSVRSIVALDQGQALAFIQEDSGKGATPYKWIQEVLSQAQWRRSDVEGILVGVGPGSYTGIRIALSMAIGWNLSRPTRLAGAPVLELLAAELWASGRRGRFGIGMDVGRKEWFSVVCQVEDSGYLFESSPERKKALDCLAAESESLTWVGPLAIEREPVQERFLSLYPGPKSMAVWLSKNPEAFNSSNTILTPLYARPVEYVKAPKNDLSFLD